MKAKNAAVGILVLAAVVVGGVVINNNRHHSASPTVALNQNDTNATVNATSPDNNTTDSNSTSSNAADANNTSATSSSSPNVVINVSSVSNTGEAVDLVTSIYAEQKMKDSNLKIEFDHKDSINGQVVYVIHVYDFQNGHIATIGWVGVRADGKVQNYTLKGNWVDASQYRP